MENKGGWEQYEEERIRKLQKIQNKIAEPFFPLVFLPQIAPSLPQTLNRLNIKIEEE